MKKIYKFLWLFALFFLLFSPVQAQEETGQAQVETQGSDLVNLMDQRVEDVRNIAGVGEPRPFGVMIGVAVRAVLSLLAVIFLVLVIIAGFTWMTAGGKEENITKAKKYLTQGIIGLAIILAAYAITFFIFNILGVGIEAPPTL